MELMIEKDFNTITITDIAERAMINRSTFYLHYNSLTEVMEDIEKEIASDIERQLQEFSLLNFNASIHRFFNAVVTTMTHNDTLQRFIIYSSNSQVLIQRIKTILTEKIYEALQASKILHCSPAFQYSICFATSGAVDTFIKWATDKDKTISLEQLSNQISDTLALIYKSDILK